MMFPFGTNIQAEIKDNKLILTIDLDQRGDVSTSGKSIMVATTSGNKQVPGTDVYAGINLYVKNNHR